VTVISKFRDFNYTDFLNEHPLTFRMWRREFLRSIPEHRNQVLSFISRVLARLLLVLFEYPGIEDMFRVKQILKGETHYDLLISFALPYPVHWGVAWAWSKKNPIAEVWVADCGDPFMLGRMDSFKKPFYFKFLEISFCKKCSYVAVPFKEMTDQFYPQFKSKIIVIPQGFNFREIKLYKGIVNNEKPLFIFAGSIIPGKRDLTMFLDFLSSLTIDFQFVVYTNQTAWYDKYKALLSDKLELHGYIDRLNLIFEMSKADFLVNVDSVLDNEYNIEAMPSKLIDYALSDRPILNIHSNYLDKEKIMSFLKKDYSGRRIVRKEDYNIEKVAASFIALKHQPVYPVSNL